MGPGRQDHVAHEPLISSKMVAEVALAGLFVTGGIVFAGIICYGRIATVGERLVAVEQEDLDQLEAADADQAPRFTEGLGYGCNKVTIIFDIEHLRTPLPDGREARGIPTPRGVGGKNKNVAWKRSTRPRPPSEATASGDQSHRRNGGDQRLSAEEEHVAHEPLE